MEIYEKYTWENSSKEEREEWERESNSFICELDEMGKKYNCDKSNVQYMSSENRNIPSDWPDKFVLKIPGHNYFQIYSEYFEPLRYEKIKILEIGMGNYPSNGNSMRLWLDYFPNAEITIIDNSKNNFIYDFKFDESRIKTYIVDQSSSSDLDNFIKYIENEKFDFIIDDGSHQADHQILSFEILFPSILKSNGVYFIEDIHDTKFMEYLPNLYKNLNNGELSSNYRLDPGVKDLGISSIHMFRSLVCIHKGKKITR